MVLFVLVVVIVPIDCTTYCDRLSIRRGLIIRKSFTLARARVTACRRGFGSSSYMDAGAVAPVDPSSVVIKLCGSAVGLGLRFR